MAATRFRPSRLAISIGTDIVSIARIRQALSRNGQPIEQRFVKKVLTARELKAPSYIYAVEQQDDDRKTFVQWLAGRWAAKEAMIKACTWRRLMMSDVEIHVHEHSRRPYGVLLDKDNGSGDRTGQVVQLSISHEIDYATAICIAAQEPSEGDVGGEAEARGFTPVTTSGRHAS